MDSELKAALATVERYADSARAHAALNTLRNELQDAPSKNKPGNRDTPGGRQSGAFGAKPNSPGAKFNNAGMVGGKT